MPQHSITDVAMVGGGGFPQPREISLAHNGTPILRETLDFAAEIPDSLFQENPPLFIIVFFYFISALSNL